MSKRPVIVVPMESSRDMRGTIDAALAVARAFGADVDLLEVVAPRRPSYLDLGESRRSLDTASATGALANGRGPIRRGPRDKSGVRTVTYPGKPMEVIPAYAQLARAAFIVVGRNYGTPRWRRTSRVVSNLSRSAPVPVLVVPVQFRVPKRSLSFRRIVSAVDFSVASAVAVRTVLNMSRKANAELTLVHALGPDRHGMTFSGSERLEIAGRRQAEAEVVARRLRRKLPPECRFRVDARVQTGDVDRAILEVAQEADADLIVIGVPPRNSLDVLLFGSTLRRLLRRARVPLLVVPVPAGAAAWLEETAAKGARRQAAVTRSA